MTLVMHVACLLEKKRNRQTDMDGPVRCSSLTLEREEHLKRYTCVHYHIYSYSKTGQIIHEQKVLENNELFEMGVLMNTRGGIHTTTNRRKRSNTRHRKRVQWGNYWRTNDSRTP
jgi:hypothetical protein